MFNTIILATIGGLCIIGVCVYGMIQIVEEMKELIKRELEKIKDWPEDDYKRGYKDGLEDILKEIEENG